jgi:hypothetical protein
MTKGVDIFAIGANRRADVIEVKASNSKRFVTSLYISNLKSSSSSASSAVHPFSF